MSLPETRGTPLDVEAGIAEVNLLDRDVHEHVVAQNAPKDVAYLIVSSCRCSGAELPLAASTAANANATITRTAALLVRRIVWPPSCFRLDTLCY